MKVLAVGTSVVAVLLLLGGTISMLVTHQSSDEQTDTNSHDITKRSNQFRPRIIRTDNIKQAGGQRHCKDGSCVMNDQGSGNQNGFDNDDEDEEGSADSWLPLEMLSWSVKEVRVPSNKTKSSLIGDRNTTVVHLVELDATKQHYRTVVKCRDVTQLVNSDLCERYPTVLPAIIQGVQLAVEETIHLLKDRRWDGYALKKKQVGENLLRQATKESAFTHAIISAGITHVVTKSCSKHLIEGCGCASNRIPETHSDDNFQWGSCSDDVYFGANVSAMFLNSQEHKRRDLRTQVNLHNNKAGRLTVISERRLQCKCHGTSGSCALRTCWMSLQRFHEVGRHIVHQYDQAVQVVSNQMKHDQLTSVSRYTFSSIRSHPDSLDLVYYEKSPRYCVRNKLVGSLGTKGRKCEQNSQSTNSCLHLCCGRGFRVKYLVEEYDCECSFRWCCRVECKTCRRKTPYHVCR